MVRPGNRLTSRGTVRSSLHEILRSPEEIRRGVKDPHSTRRPCRRAGTTEKVQTNGDGDLLYLRSKLTDMEDRSQRDNIRLHGIPENEEGVDMQSFLRSILPKLTTLDFDPPIEFQRVHRVGPKRLKTPTNHRMLTTAQPDSSNTSSGTQTRTLPTGSA
ncbi:hypothetical protein NDU88_011259 [Pleurodeles waltl]|uniref:Uncharacterized protein n=1 Tax=Pleurodeles waltl TaxID=8319 RepID=A0AAV7Q474_PLEWA|nr:hypothetical protein NDU88_011259 [Pleurodeles waltl]